MRTAFSILLFFYCINFGLYFIGVAFGVNEIAALNQIDFEAERASLVETANNTATTANFGASNPFGNFAQGIQVFWHLMAALGGGAILNVLTGIGLPDSFVLPLSVVVVIIVIFALIYLITGRGSELSA